MTKTPSKLRQLFDDYASYHKTRGNQLTHRIGIPAILIGLLGILSQWVIWSMPDVWWRIDGGLVLWAAAAIWYLQFNRRLVVPYLCLVLVVYALGRELQFPVQVAFFLGGWAIQFIGHARFERKKPAFLKNVAHLFVGPLWIFAKAIRFERV